MGVSLTITPLLSLGADREEKMRVRVNQSEGSVVPIHLDEVCSVAYQVQVVSRVNLLSQDTHATLFLFSSPQAICDNQSLWKDLIH